jgi:hypothetical protein
MVIFGFVPFFLRINILELVIKVVELGADPLYLFEDKLESL